MNIAYTRLGVHKDILRLAWPAIAEQVLIMMVGMVSTIFVGRIGTSSLAAVGLINMLVFFLQSVFAGLATGSTVVIARVTGEGEDDKAKLALTQSLIMGVIAGLALAVLGYLFASPLLRLFFGAAEPVVIEIGLLYYRIVLLGLPFLVIDMVIAGALRGAGDTKTPMYVTAVVNIINLVLSSTLIFGVKIGGSVIIPPLGVTGAGISVTVARISGGVIRLCVLYLRKGNLSMSLKDKYRVDMDMMARIIKVGIPAFMEQLVMQGGFLVMQIIIISIGTVQAASFQVGVNVNSLAFMPIFGFAVSATTMVGQNLGCCDYDNAETYAHETNKIAIAIISCIGVLTFIFARPLAGLYSNDAEVINMGAAIIRIFAFTEPLLGIMNVCSGVLRAAGDVMYVMITALVGLWLFRVAIAYILGKTLGFGIYGVMAGVCADFAVRASMYGFRVKAGKWKYLKV